MCRRSVRPRLAALLQPPGFAGIVACYSVLVPMLYHPTELYGLAALGSHGVALVLLWRTGIPDDQTRRPAVDVTRHQ